ncbi:MAG: copper amine oxidase N-terminal domain-containing protein [Actinomycetota bacterium]
MKKTRSHLLPLLAIAAATVPAADAIAQIQVEVNSRAVQFGAVQPVRVNGRVFIPLRAVVESLGAEIKWEPATQTVRGRKGEREFSLQINSRLAMLNGQETTLDAPAQMISGTTMVPLRFVAEALGAEVEWNGARQQVVTTPAAHDAPVAAGGRSQGDLVTVRRDELTVRVGNVRQTYAIGRDTIVLRGAEGARAQTVEPRDLRAGDQLKLRVNAETGVAEVVEATFARMAEAPDPDDDLAEIVEVRDRRGRRSITVQSGDRRETVELPLQTPLYRSSGNQAPARVELGDLRIGDRVRFGRNAGGQITRVDATAETRVAGDDEVTGEIVAVRGKGIVVRSGNDRAGYDVNANTVISRATGNQKGVRVTLQELEPGDQVVVRLDATGAIARAIEAKAVGAAEPAPAADLRVNSFTHDGGELLKAGEEIRVTLVGTPKAQASFDAGAVAKDVPLTEDPQRPGRYSAILVVPKGITAKEVPVIGQVRRDGRSSPLIQASRALTVDSEAPTIAEVAPKDQSETTNQQPDIYLEISDGSGSGVDSRSIKVEEGGKDVTDQVKTTPRFLLYSPRDPFKPGRVPVRVSLTDMAGNPATVNWAFTVRQAPVSVQSVSHDGDRPLRAGDTLNITVKGQPKSRATFSLGDLATAIPLKETEAGVYTGSYRVRAGDRALKAPVVVDFVTPGGTKVRQETSAPVNIVAGKVEPPVITFPKGRPMLGDELVVEGTAAPGAKVVVEISYTGKAFGALPVKGTFGSHEAVADKNGRWVTEPFEVRLSLGVRRPLLSIRAIAVDAADQQSEPTDLELQTR